MKIILPSLEKKRKEKKQHYGMDSVTISVQSTEMKVEVLSELWKSFSFFVFFPKLIKNIIVKPFKINQNNELYY